MTIAIEEVVSSGDVWEFWCPIEGVYIPKGCDLLLSDGSLITENGDDDV